MWFLIFKTQNSNVFAASLSGFFRRKPGFTGTFGKRLKGYIFQEIVSMEIWYDYIQTIDIFYFSDHVLRTLWTSMLRSLWRMLQLLR